MLVVYFTLMSVKTSRVCETSDVLTTWFIADIRPRMFLVVFTEIHVSVRLSTRQSLGKDLRPLTKPVEHRRVSLAVRVGVTAVQHALGIPRRL